MEEGARYDALLQAASKTAGSESWKTCAGRKSGPEHFIPSDAWRCMKISLKRHMNTKKKRNESSCPVCLDDTVSDDNWYTTKSCNHTVCRSCLQSYCQSLLSNPSHTGPLKCPCCPRLLREDDAKVALSLAQNKNAQVSKKNNKKKEEIKEDEESSRAAAVDLLEQWTIKARNELLRKMQDYRPCPNCCESSNTGGGFVTRECLAPINDERESAALVFVTLAEKDTVKLVLLAFTLYYLYCCGYAAQGSEVRQVAMAILPSIGLPVFPQMLNLLIARIARRHIMRPIVVTCPCCEKEFSLPASEVNVVASSADESEVKSQNWKAANTRNCPTCASPIEKNGGCNHVRCGRCQSEFCWACMRSRTNCRAYNCQNGAPYGNASARPGLTHRQLEQLTLVERIDRLEFTALQQLRLFPRARPELCIPIFGWLFFDSMAGSAIWWLLREFASLAVRLFCVAFVTNFLYHIVANARRDEGATFRATTNQRRGGHAFQTDAQMMSEAIARSIREY